MAVSWLSLPEQWRLEDVQAGLNVTITVLSTLGIFAFVRFSWQHAARRIAKDYEIPLPALLSLNTLGEAADAFRLFGQKLLQRQYFNVLAQCLLVICLSTTALLSGPIARYSSRYGHIVRQRATSGLLATRHHNGMNYANVEWNLTYQALERAGFPLDQLLDWRPPNGVNWVYEPGEWNSSWSLDCNQTDLTPIALEDTGNCTNDAYSFRYEIPAFEQIINYDSFDDFTFSWGGFYNERNTYKDILLFIHGWTMAEYQNETETYQSVDISLVAVHMHSLPRNNSNENLCDFAPGKIGPSSYTKIECHVQRHKAINDSLNIAFPDNYSPNMLPQAYTMFYQARFTQQSTSGSPITVITPAELVRFYQVYTIVKDLQYRQPTTRNISVNLRVVQLSTVFLAIAIITAVLILLGLLSYTTFAIRHRHILFNTPQSKLDWMMQSIQTEDRPMGDSKGRLRRSVTVDSSNTLSTLPSTRRKRMEFERARYGSRQTTTWFLRDDQVGQTAYEQGPSTSTSAPSDHSKTPMLNVAGIEDEFELGIGTSRHGQQGQY